MKKLLFVPAVAALLLVVGCQSPEQRTDAAVEGQEEVQEERAEASKEIFDAQVTAKEKAAEAAKEVGEAHKQVEEEAAEAAEEIGDAQKEASEDAHGTLE